jgi:hypothetical protein
VLVTLAVLLSIGPLRLLTHHEATARPAAERPRDDPRALPRTRPDAIPAGPRGRTAPFFAPAFALDFGQIHQTRPYVSPDTDEWLVANATLIPQADGRKRAIVHFEVTVESFRRAIGNTRGVDPEIVPVFAEVLTLARRAMPRVA